MSVFRKSDRKTLLFYGIIQDKIKYKETSTKCAILFVGHTNLKGASSCWSFKIMIPRLLQLLKTLFWPLTLLLMNWLLFAGNIPRGVLPWIWQNPETYGAKCHHRRWFGMHFDQVAVNGVNSNRQIKNAVSTGLMYFWAAIAEYYIIYMLQLLKKYFVIIKKIWYNQIKK